MHDVRGDGNCFFRAILKCLIRDPDILWALGVSEHTMKAGITGLRQAVADEINNGSSVQEWVKDLMLLSKDCPESLEDFPALQEALEDAQDNADITASLANAIATNGTWVSEIEVKVMQDLFLKIDITLFVISVPSRHSIKHDYHMEERLLSALQQDISSSRCMVLIHVNNDHYMYMSLDKSYLPDPKTLREYLVGFLESESESESTETEQPEEGSSSAQSAETEQPEEDLWTKLTHQSRDSEQHYESEPELDW